MNFRIIELDNTEEILLRIEKASYSKEDKFHVVITSWGRMEKDEPLELIFEEKVNFEDCGNNQLSRCQSFIRDYTDEMAEEFYSSNTN